MFEILLTDWKPDVEPESGEDISYYERLLKIKGSTRMLEKTSPPPWLIVRVVLNSRGEWEPVLRLGSRCGAMVGSKTPQEDLTEAKELALGLLKNWVSGMNKFVIDQS